MYTDPRVVDFVTRHFTPVRVHVKENAAAFAALGERFDAQWTPTILIVDSDGVERHRIEGFIPADEFLAQLALGVAKAAFARKDYAAAEGLYRDVADKFPSSDAAPEAQYLVGRIALQGNRRCGCPESHGRRLRQPVSGFHLGDESVRVAIAAAAACTVRVR